MMRTGALDMIYSGLLLNHMDDLRFPKLLDATGKTMSLGDYL